MACQKVGKKAVVIGSGFAGLLAGRVLSDYFARVTIIERDVEPTAPTPRKGVPQGHHIHVLLKAGEEVLSDLCPGITDDLLKEGATQAILGKDVRWHLAGQWFPPFEQGLNTFFQSRPMLEHVLRQHVSRRDNIEFMYGQRNIGYRFNSAGNRVEATILQNVETGEKSEQSADLVIDASGAGTDILKQLSAYHFPTPRESVVEPDFAYASGFFEMPADWSGKWKSILIYPKAPVETRGGAFVPVEGRRWMVTAAGYSGDYPPIDLEGFMEFLKSLPEPDVFEAVSRAHLIGNLQSFKFKKGVRRHFEELKRFPQSLLVMGDGMCRANPFFWSRDFRCCVGGKSPPGKHAVRRVPKRSGIEKYFRTFLQGRGQDTRYFMGNGCRGGFQISRDEGQKAGEFRANPLVQGQNNVGK